MLGQWTACVKEDLLPGLHGHQANALAAVSLGAALAGHCHGGRVAPLMPGGRARPGGAGRRYERLLANPRRLAVRGGELPAASGMLAKAVLSPVGRAAAAAHAGRDAGGRRGCRCLRVSAAHRGPRRAAGVVLRPRGRAARADAAAGVAAAEPHRPRLGRGGRGPGRRDALVADRGLSWPSVLDCLLRGAGLALRAAGAQGATRVGVAVQVARGRGRGRGRVRAVEARSPAPREGGRWSGRVRAFTKAGWRRVHFSAVRERGCKEPGLLASDRPGLSSRHVLNYGKRSRCEQSHRDDKSAAFNWQASRVTDPAHACRLLLVPAPATLLAAGTGARVLTRGLRRRRRLDARLRRTLSLVQLGLRWLRHALVADDAPELPLFPLALPP
jgi:hypothetical protein